MSPFFVSVALPVPLFQTFTYAVEDADRDRVVPGSRVVVTVRNRREIGIVVATGVAVDGAHQYKSLSTVSDERPALPPPLLDTCRWLADFYAAPLGIVVRAVLPGLLAGASEPSPRPRMRRVVLIDGRLDTLFARAAAFNRAPRQRQVYELLESLGGRASADHLQKQLGATPAVLRGLRRRGLLRFEWEPHFRDPFAARPAHPTAAHEPTLAQRDAINRVTSGGAGAVFLLHGVTGSGKTLVYIEVLRRIVGEQGKTAIVLVPEIGLTPQTVGRFRAAFGDTVAVLHSGLSDGERLDAWRAIRNGQRRIVVGARSAIFAPLETVGAIIVDEEHESSYKQNETPRYHARDVAIMRARREGAVVVLGSATPSLESWGHAGRGRYDLISLPERVGGGTLPRVEVVDLRQRTPRAVGMPDAFHRAISPPLEHALEVCLERREQAILLLNRRGYAAFVQCQSCGDVAVCPNCAISLTVHRAPERLICHYCAHSEPLREVCLRCHQRTALERGLGTQQVERLLADRFPAARIARMDVDTTSAKWAHADILDRVGVGDIDILLGTQMIAKGLDFPNVTLVGVVDADVGMNLPDFRAAERCFDLMAQVAGRAGRGPKGGVVYIQTRLPDHHAVRCAVTHDCIGFMNRELADRQSPPYPPTIHLANIVFSGVRESETVRLAERGADWLGRLIGSVPHLGISLIGPAPCPIEKIKGRWRWHILLKSERSPALTRVGRYFAGRFPVPSRGSLRAIVDRDPTMVL